MNGHTQAQYAANRLTTLLFAIYLVALGWILLFKMGVRFSYMKARRVQLIPFNEPSILSGENIMNVVVFIPLGIYAAILFKRWSFGIKVLSFCLLSTLVEVLQYILSIGAFDITDILTNTLGGIIGWMMYKGLVLAFRDSSKAQRFLNMFAAAATIVMILLLVLLKMNMLPVRYQ